MLIQVEGKNKFLGQIGQFRGKRAIKYHADAPAGRKCATREERGRERLDEPGRQRRGRLRRSPSAGKGSTVISSNRNCRLHSLVFLLPVMVCLSWGLVIHHPSDGRSAVSADCRWFFRHAGATGSICLPLLSVVAILLTWHIARKDPWEIRFETLWAMALESVVLALPLLALGISVSPLADSYSAGWRHAAVGESMRYCLWGQGFTRNSSFGWGLMTLFRSCAADVLQLRQMVVESTNGGQLRRCCSRSTITWVPRHFRCRVLCFEQSRESILGCYF